MIYYISVAGTYGAKQENDWYMPESEFSKFLLGSNCMQLEVNPLKRYMWSTELDGVTGGNLTWDAAGRALAHYIMPPLANQTLVKPEDTYIISHSHGGNVVAYACGKYGLKVDGLITVGMPIRRDLHEIYQAANPNIARHLHIYAGWKDYWQVWGALFDGRFGIHRRHPFAAKNERVPCGNHGSVLRDPKFFHLWLERGWLDFWMNKNAGQ